MNASPYILLYIKLLYTLVKTAKRPVAHLQNKM